MFSEKALGPWDPAPFAATLKRAGYTARTAEDIGIKSLPDPFARTAVVSRTFPGSPLSTAYRLFDAGEPVTGRDALQLFGEQLHGLVTLGLIEPLGNDLVRSVAHLDAGDGGWFASDHAASLLSNRTDYTMGIGLSTRMLSALAPGRPGDTALDLCTGAGWGAIRLAGAGCKVTAADINTRALGFARLNARLAECPGIEFIEGDLFTPVADRRFDVITANPPFVISPEATFTFRDSGLGGDSFCEHLARRMPDHLNPGGIGVMLLNWYDDGHEKSSTRPLDWVEGSGCGAWLLRSLTQNPADYATRWLRDSGRGRTPSPETLDRWVSYLTEIGARRIHYGFLVIHRTRGPAWTRAESRGIETIEPTAGAEVRRVVEGEAWLALHQPDDARLLDGHHTVTDGIRAETDMVLDKGWGGADDPAHQPRQAQLRRPDRRIPASPAGALPRGQTTRRHGRGTADPPGPREQAGTRAPDRRTGPRAHPPRTAGAGGWGMRKVLRIRNLQHQQSGEGGHGGSRFFTTNGAG